MSQLDDTTAAFKEICSQSPKIDEILQCSPFDKTRNFGGCLTPKLFFQRLFIETEQVKALELELIEALTSDIENNRIIFLEGYSGTGKTTFIHHFKEKHTEFQSIYIDFYPRRHSIEPINTRVPDADELKETQNRLRELKDHLPGNEERALVQKAIKQLTSVNLVSSEFNRITEQNHPIALVIKSYLNRDRDAIEDFLFYLQANRNSLSGYFEKFSESLAKIEPLKAVNELESLWLDATLRDTFILFFLYYINKYRRDPATKAKLNLFIFDNLDTIELAYLTPFFKQSFANALGLFSEILQNGRIFPEKIDFEHHFKFIFCLRDANNSTINAHLGDRLYPIATTINLRVGFEGELYKSALARRLQFYSDVTGECDTHIGIHARKVVGMLTAFSTDHFFTRILVPLYNSDFRKLINSLFQVTKNLVKSPHQPGGLSFDNIGDSFTESAKDKYGMRGALFFGIICKLKEDNFLSDYPFTKDNPNENSGYCLTTRMLLTLILNKSRLYRGADVFTKRKPFSDVSLGTVIDEAKDLYPINEIVATLVEIFLFHQRSWVHLVTFRDRPVENINSFQSEMDKLIHESDLPASLYQVYLTLNPAGYIFLKNLLVHFEFYSALGGNSHALFMQGLAKSEDGYNRFEFEETIGKVIRLVRRHSSAMQRFFEVKFEQGRKMTHEEYLTSNFVFKHYKHTAPAEVGLFHATRVVFNHITYIDKFRTWVLSRAENLDEHQKVEINKKLVGFLERYIAIVEDWPYGLVEVRNEISKRIAHVKSTKYSDFSAPIDLPPGTVPYYPRHSPRRVNPSP